MSYGSQARVLNPRFVVQDPTGPIPLFQSTQLPGYYRCLAPEWGAPENGHGINPPVALALWHGLRNVA